MGRKKSCAPFYFSVGTQWVTPTYDRNGNTTTLPDPADLTSGYPTAYDAWNRLVKVANATGQTVAGYQYDVLNRRIVEKNYAPPGTLAETRDLYYSNQWQVQEERVDGSSLAERQYVWGIPYVDCCVLRDRDTTGGGSFNERLYALQDANWNVVALCDITGTVQERFAYTPYGVVTIYSPTWTAPVSVPPWQYLFQGGRFEVLTGLYYFRNRDYLPVLGSWVQRDPIGYRARDVNLTRYEANSPTDATDPSGLVGDSLTITLERSIENSWNNPEALRNLLLLFGAAAAAEGGVHLTVEAQQRIQNRLRQLEAPPTAIAVPVRVPTQRGWTPEQIAAIKASVEARIEANRKRRRLLHI